MFGQRKEDARKIVQRGSDLGIGDNQIEHPEQIAKLTPNGPELVCTIRGPDVLHNFGRFIVIDTTTHNTEL